MAVWVSIRDDMLWVAAVSFLGATLFLQPESSYENLLDEGRRFVEAKDWERATDAFREASELEPRSSVPHLEMARVYLLSSDSRAALQAIDRALALSPGDVSARSLRATVLMSMGLFDEAKLELAVAVDRYPGDMDVRRQLALAALRAGDAAQVLEALSPIVEEGASPNASDWALFGSALFQLGRTEEAVAPLERSLEANPEQPQALLYLGQSLLSLGRAEEAARIFERGARFPPPQNVRFELGAIEAELRLERQERVRTLLESLLERHPRVARGWYVAGVVAANQGRHEDAARAFESAIEYGHRSAPTYLNLGVAQIAIGNRPAARQSFATALEMDPELAAAHYYQGILAFEEGDPGRAVSHLERAAALESDEPRTQLALAEAYVQLRRFEDAEAAATKAAADSEDLAPRALYWKGLAQHESIQYPQAETSYREAIALGLDDVEVHLNLARALYAMARHKEALVAVDDALDRTPERGEAHLLKGKIETELRHYESALDHLQRATEILPEVADVWFRKGIVHSRLSHNLRAIEDWRRALSLDPDMLDAYYRLGSALVREGAVDDGQEFLAEFQRRSSAEEQQEHQIAKLKTTLRRAIDLSENGQIEEALTYFDEALEIAPLDPLPYLYLAEFRARRGDMDRARATLLRGLEVLPRHLSLHRALLSVYEASNMEPEANAERIRIAELEALDRTAR